MIQVNIHDVKTNLSHFVNLALSGKRVIIARRNKPVIELKPLRQKKGKRLLGQSRGKVILTKEFFEPLPDSLLQAFNSPK